MGLDLLGVENFGHRFNLYQWLHAFAPCCILLQLVQTNPVGSVPSRHVTQNYRVPFMQPFQHLDGVHRGAPYLDGNADGSFAFRIQHGRG